mmetsp:Transcript_34781/g.68669  ORF Transcript_34781/g.68669 Transcript_34781/m.68669 type:complete len:132 (-) Transcript_34781:266-661(-)
MGCPCLPLSTDRSAGLKHSRNHALLSETSGVSLDFREDGGPCDELALKGRLLLGKALVDDCSKALIVKEQLHEHLPQDIHAIAQVLEGGHNILVDAVCLLLPVTSKRANHLIHPWDINAGRRPLVRPSGSR